MIITKLSNPLQENGMPNVRLDAALLTPLETNPVLHCLAERLPFPDIFLGNKHKFVLHESIPHNTHHDNIPVLNKIKNFQPVFYIFPGSPTV